MKVGRINVSTLNVLYNGDGDVFFCKSNKLLFSCPGKLCLVYIYVLRPENIAFQAS